MQYNDPDSLYWIGIYSFVALSSLLAMFDKLNYYIIGAGFLGLLLLITNAFQTVEDWTFDSEEGREIFGLIISCNWMGMLGIFKLYQKSYG